MPIVSAVGLFCCDKFEETQNEKVVNMSKLTKSYFSILLYKEVEETTNLYLLENRVQWFKRPETS